MEKLPNLQTKPRSESRLKYRSQEQELMDQPNLPTEEMGQILDEISILNKSFGSLGPFQSFLKRLHSEVQRPLLVCDLGCGSGTQLGKLWDWGQECGIPLRLVGVDCHSAAIANAHQAHAKKPFDFICCDAVEFLKQQRPQQFDIFYSSLFMHHMRDQDIVDLIGLMTDRSLLGWYVDDLQRSWVSRTAIDFITRAGRFHPVVQNDSVVSVERAFRQEDWQKYLAAAGVPRSAYSIHWRWAFRYSVEFLHQI